MKKRIKKLLIICSCFVILTSCSPQSNQKNEVFTPRYHIIHQGSEIFEIFYEDDNHDLWHAQYVLGQLFEKDSWRKLEKPETK